MNEARLMSGQEMLNSSFYLDVPAEEFCVLKFGGGHKSLAASSEALRPLRKSTSRKISETTSLDLPKWPQKEPRNASGFKHCCITSVRLPNSRNGQDFSSVSCCLFWPARCDSIIFMYLMLLGRHSRVIAQHSVDRNNATCSSPLQRARGASC